MNKFTDEYLGSCELKELYELKEELRENAYMLYMSDPPLSVRRKIKKVAEHIKKLENTIQDKQIDNILLGE